MKILHLAAFVLAVYILSFLAIEHAGLFSAQSPPLFGVLRFWMVMLAAMAIMILLLFSAIANRNRIGPAHWLGVVSVGLIVGGIWISRLTDFAIDLAVTEGQFYETDQHRSMGLLYAGMISPVPKIKLRLDEVELAKGRGQTAELTANAKFLLQPPGWAAPRPVIVSQGMPHFQGGVFLRIKKFGYSPRYVMKKGGKVLESDFISMRLYPHGSEDYFRLLSPHTFSLRYYPGHFENGAERPLKVKIARNKDIIFNAYVGLNQDIMLEDAKMSFAEIRKWVEVSIGRTWGEMIAWAGLALGCVSLSFLLLNRIRSRFPI